MNGEYPRDLKGYGRDPPHARWPGRARIALQFVLNFEEGAENCVLDGDPSSETFLSEIIGAQAYPMRHMSMESLYEYGARAGLWRVLRAFERHGLPLTVFAVAAAIRRHPEAATAFTQLGHEIACHGLRWISYQEMDPDTERAHMAEAVAILERTFGTAPLGWYTGRDSPQTRRLLVEHGGFVYDSDSYADDLPYWTGVAIGGAIGDAAPGAALETRVVPHLVVPYALDTNDMRFATAQGFNSGPQFFDYLTAAFDTLYREGDPDGLDRPKMLSVGLHCRLAGRPGRVQALERFLGYVLEHEHVWIARRIDIARHWIATHPHASERKITVPELNALPPDRFVAQLAGIFEHSPWVAERAAARRPFASRAQLLVALRAVVEAATPDEQLQLIRAHPRLRRRASEPLTAASSREQRGAGLAACTPAEAARLEELNEAYAAKFAMPFILAVRGHTPASIIAACERRLHNGGDDERRAALHEIGLIAGHRLAEAVADDGT
jgi:OHCU decarboxylase